jgi:hypothetical protein
MGVLKSRMRDLDSAREIREESSSSEILAFRYLIGTLFSIIA